MLLGIVRAYFNGRELPVKKDGCTLNLGGVVNKPQVFGTQVDASQAMQPTEAKLRIVIQQGVRLTDLVGSASERGELQVQCDTGQTFVGENAFRSDTVNITVGENSEAEVTYNCGMMLEV